MSGRRPEDVEYQVQAWLDRVGWERNPFARPGTLVEPLTRAEEEAEKLQEYFIPSVIEVGWPSVESRTRAEDDLGWFDELLWNRHSVLFAEIAEGKTATRLMVTRELASRGVAVEYLDFDPRPCSVEVHAQEIGRRLSQALGRRYGTQTAIPTSWLSSFCQRQTQPIFTLVDNVEANLGAQFEVDDVERVIEHLFNPRILEISGLWLKFFLPASLADRLNSYYVFRSGAPSFSVVHIHWTEARMHHLLETRIAQVSRQATTLESISANEHGQPFDLDGEVTRVALEQPGAPRRLLRLANEVICAHAKNEPNIERFRLTCQDLNDAIRSYALQFPGPFGTKREGTMKPVDFVIVTALEEERDAVLNKLAGYQKLMPSDSDIRVYFQADLPVTFPGSSTGTYRIVVMPLLGMGRLQAAAATGDAIRQWRPRYVILIGIAGGIAARGVKLGDILISDQIVDYELQKLTPAGPEIRWEVHRADPRLVGAARNFSDEGWQKLMGTSRPGPGKPRRHIGPIASGDKVIAFSEVLVRYRDTWPKLIGVEMEAAGVATATFQAAKPPGFFMVRGVSDLADEAKGSPSVEKWRLYACDVAASYAIGLLKSGPVLP